MVKKSLGRGLEALIPASEPAASQSGETGGEGQSVLQLPLEQIRANRWQPRQDFDEIGIEELAASFNSSGLLQPIVVQRGEHGYELIAGERRLRAARKAGWRTIPAILTEVDEQRRLQLALVENIQRENLNPMEEALAYQNLLQVAGCTQEELAALVGKERSTISNSLRLLKLPPEIQQDLREGLISSGHARAILSLQEPREQFKLCRLIRDKGYSVRQAEEYVKKLQQNKTKPGLKPPVALDPILSSIQEKMTRRLATKVQISPAPKGKGGKIVIEYYSNEDLERVIQSMQIT